MPRLEVGGQASRPLPKHRAKLIRQSVRLVDLPYAAPRHGAYENHAKSAYSFINFALRLQISAKLLTPSVAPALRMVYQVHRVRRTADRPNEVHAP